jgi:hypothetical protein
VRARGGERGRWAAALWRGGDAAWRSEGAVESTVAEAEHGHRGSMAERRHGLVETCRGATVT